MDYAWHYERMIHRARDRQLPESVYSERHHIVPRCLGGQDDRANLVDLTPEEHYVAHQLLLKMFPRNPKLTFAAWAMCQGRDGTNKRYGWLRKAFAQRVSDAKKGIPLGPMPEWHKERLRGPKSEEHKAALSEARRKWRTSPEHLEKMIAARRGVPHSEETRAKLSAAHIGKVLTEEHKAKLSAAKIGKKRGPRRQVTCPHCDRTGPEGAFHRWHFDNCRERKDGA